MYCHMQLQSFQGTQRSNLIDSLRFIYCYGQFFHPLQPVYLSGRNIIHIQKIHFFQIGKVVKNRQTGLFSCVNR